MKNKDFKILTRRMIDGVTAQGKPSCDGNMCVYRNKGGLKCAVGHAIPDELYQPRFDSQCMTADVIGGVLGWNLTPVQKIKVSEIQVCHDRASARPMAGELEGFMPRWIENVTNLVC